MSDVRLPAQVVSVEDQVAGDELAVDALSGQAVLSVWDATHFNEVGGGTLELDDTNGTTTVLAYATANLDLNTITLSANLAATWPAGTQVRVSPYEITRVAYVQPLDGVPEGELVSCRVPFTMRDRVPVNERTGGLGEVIEMERVGYTYVLADVLGSLPVIGTESLDMAGIGAALPAAPSTDLLPPTSSPTPTVRAGIEFLAAEWDPVANHDVVTYEVHISSVGATFTPGPTTLYGEIAGTIMFIQKLPDGSPLVVGTTYYVRLIAKDFDGAAAVGTAGSGTPIKLPSSLAGTDSVAPASSPTPTVLGGIGILSVKWTPITNNDAVTYDVHLSTTTGFTPSGTTPGTGTCVGSTAAGSFVINSTVAGGALAYGTTYYVKLVARDADGSAAAGAQGSGSLVQVTAPDISSVPSNKVTNDGAPPASSPATTVQGGVGFLNAFWLPIANNDPVTYAVHISATTGFTPSGGAPGAGTWYATTSGTSIVLKTLADGVTALVTGTTYYVRVIAMDANGSAAAGTQGSAAPLAIAIVDVPTLPSSKITNDGAIPSAATAPTVVGGPSFLSAFWTPVANNDPVTYEVHLSTSSGFTPSGTTAGTGTCYAVTSASSTIIKTTVAGAALAYATPYYVKIVAKDANGSAAASGQGTASLVQVATVDIGANAITSTEIASNAITTPKLNALAVDASKIAANTITAAQIAANTITATQIAADTITAAQIAANAITSSELAAGAVIAGKITAGTIVAADIASGTITSTQIAADTITAANIAANAITASELAANAVIAGKIAAGTIVAADIASGTITATQIAGDTITAGQIAANAITASELAANSVVAGDLQAGAVTAGTIAAGAIVANDIASGTITATQIAGDTITASQIAANAITASELAANSVVAGDLQAGAVTAGTIAANAVTATEILAGSITAAKLFSNIVLSTTIATAASGQRVVMTGTLDYGSVGLYLLRTNSEGLDETVASITTQDGAAFGELTVGTLYSDDVVTFNKRAAQTIFVDSLAADDTGDGSYPTTLLADTFNRTGSAGWGTASDGRHIWTPSDGGTAPFTTVAGSPGLAKMQCATAAQRTITVDSGSVFEEVRITQQLDKIPVGGNNATGILFRALNKTSSVLTTSGTYIRVEILTTPGATVPSLRIVQVIEGSASTLVNTTLPDGQVNVAATNWSIRAQCYTLPNGSTRVRAYAWKSSGTEPSTWLVSQDIANNLLDMRSGQVGFWTNNTGITNAPITSAMSGFSYALLDPELLWADDSDTTPGIYTYAPSGGAPFQTLERAFRSVDRYNQGQVFIIYEWGSDVPYWPHVQMDGFVGGGKLIITAGAGAVITGTLNVVGSSHFVRIAGCVVTDDNSAADEATNATILVNTSRHVEVVMCQLQGNNPNAQYNVAFIQGSEGNVTNCQLNGASSATVRATEASIIKCEDNKGNGPQSYNSSASIIFKNGTWPTGGGATGSQGIIITAGGIGPAIDTPATPAGDASGNQGPTSTKKTKTWAAAAGSTYGLSYNTWSGGDVTQGSYGGSQNHKGLWRLPSGVAGTLGGKNIQAAYVTITRASYGGGSGAVAVMLATFNQNVLSGAGNPGVNDGPANVGALAWGQTKTFKIANSWVDYLKGGGRTLGVYAASGSPYAIFKNNLKLKVTYI